MRDAGIDDGDVVLMDRVIEPAHGQVVVALFDGDFTVKRLWNRDGNSNWKAENPS